MVFVMLHDYTMVFVMLHDYTMIFVMLHDYTMIFVMLHDHTMIFVMLHWCYNSVESFYWLFSCSPWLICTWPAASTSKVTGETNDFPDTSSARSSPA